MRGFRNQGSAVDSAVPRSKADEIFAYLHKVRSQDGDIAQPEEEVQDQKPGSRSAVGRLFGYEKPVQKKIPDRPNITFTSVMPKKSSAKAKASEKAEGLMAGIGNISLGKIDDTIRKYTGSPLVRAGALGLLGAGAIYAAYPWLDEPDPVYSTMYGGDKAYNTRRNWVTALTGIGLASLGIYASKHPNIKSSWYKYLPKKNERIPLKDIQKTASMLGPADFVPLGFAQKAVMESPTMSLDNKYRAVQMLNAIPGGYNTPVTATDIVSSAINTGASSAGYPVGRATVGAVADALMTYAGAKAFGSDNPGGLAAKVGLGSLGLRLVGSLF